MNLKLETDVTYLRSIGISQAQIMKMLEKSNPDHWLNRLPQDTLNSFNLNCHINTPEEKSEIPFQIFKDEIQPSFSFYDKEDAEFVAEKCNLLIEMSNYAYSVNRDWKVNWQNKDQKKFGIVLQNGTAMIKENELFNIFVFGIAVKEKSFAFEMLTEFKNRIEKYFNKSFNSYLVTNLFPDLKDELFQSLKDIDDQPIKEKTVRKRRKEIIDADIPKIQELLLAKVQQKEIAEQFNYSQGTISRIKESLGFQKRKRGIR